jgi:hypothetical protein
MGPATPTWFMFMLMGRDRVSELRPPKGLLFINYMIHKCGELRWNYTDKGKPKNSEKIMPQYHFVHHKTHMD